MFNMMKFYSFVLLVGLLLLGIQPCRAWSEGLIPYPTKMVQSEGAFQFTPQTKLSCDKALADLYPFYKELLEAKLGFNLAETGGKGGQLLLNVDKRLGLLEEGYRLNITNKKIKIEASDPKGVFYGLQSLFQLMERKTAEKTVTVPSVSVEDVPRFGWRGLMLDVSRTFMPVPLVKRYIDLMAAYKLNVLHLHLTDDQGWRIEIKKYPRLTTVGSRFDSEFNEMGGYYTQEDIRDMVAYAALRNVTIVPEIDLPAHSGGALVAYPWLSCREVAPEIYPYVLGTGINGEILCAGKPEVYNFIYGVLDEVMELFPSEYIHIGGDEAPKGEWRRCPHCQQMIKEHHLKNVEELQSLFVKKLGEYLASKGRKLIGWDEIMEGGKLKGDETMTFWRGWAAKKVEDCARKGFKVVAAPNTHCYFDYPHMRIDTRKVYSFEPIPADMPADKRGNYIGIQACFWSHKYRAESLIDRQLFPRLFALAEAAWTSPENKNWERFKQTARLHGDMLREGGINCHHDPSLLSDN